MKRVSEGRENCTLGYMVSDGIKGKVRGIGMRDKNIRGKSEVMGGR